MGQEKSFAELKRIASTQQKILASAEQELRRKEEALKMGEAMIEQRAVAVKAAQNDTDYRTVEQAMDFAIRTTPLPWLATTSRIAKQSIKMLNIREQLKKSMEDARETMNAIKKTLDEVTAINQEMKDMVDAYKNRQDEVVAEQNNQEHNVEESVQA